MFWFRKESTTVRLQPSNLSILDYLKFTNELKIHRWLDDVLKKIPAPDSGTTLAEVKEKQNSVNEIISEIGDANRRFSYVMESVGKEQRDEIVPMANMVKEYLKRTVQECKNISQALEAPVSSGSSTNYQNSINVLEAEASKVNKTIEAIMEKNGISDQDAGYQYRRR